MTELAADETWFPRRLGAETRTDGDVGKSIEIG